MSDLSQKKCVPCHGGVPTLTKEVVDEYLKAMEGWALEGEAIEKTFSFQDFKEALNFLNKVAAIAEEEGHHPDIGIEDYSNVRISLSTHAVKGLTENDFIMAAKINLLIS